MIKSEYNSNTQVYIYCTNLLELIKCSLPLFELAPQCKWNWAKLNMSFNPPPLIDGTLSMGKVDGKLYNAV